MKNRTIRAAWWVRCRLRRRGAGLGGGKEPAVADRGAVRGDDARRRAGSSRERRCRAPAGDMFSSLPRVSTLTLDHGFVYCSPARRPMTHAAAPRFSSAKPSSPGGHRAGISWPACHDGADGRHPQLDGGPAGTADRAAHRARRDIEVTRDPPVPRPGRQRPGPARSARPTRRGAAAVRHRARRA